MNPEINVNSMFADDVAILAIRPSLEEAEKATQEAVQVVSEWAKKWKLRLNASKSESSFFSTSPSEAAWTPRVEVDGTRIKYEATPSLLGVIFDRTLQFSPHKDHLIKKIESKMLILQAVSNIKWGWRKENLIQIYSAHINSAIGYSGFTWLASTAKTHRERLERPINKVLRCITGQNLATLREALRLECNIPSLETQTSMKWQKQQKKHKGYQRTTQENWRMNINNLP